MNALLVFEARRTAGNRLTYLTALILIFSGIFCGNRFNLTVGEGISLNSPYTIGFITGMLSLSVIFLAIIYAGRLLFKDTDAKFDRILFSLPLAKRTYLNGRFSAYLLQTFFSFVLLILGFAIGQNLRTDIQAGFRLWHYLYPLLIFGFMNSLLVCSLLFFISVTTHKKLLVVTGGLLLYVFYMVVLIFSNSPFMAASTPQSPEAQQISAIADPFGISSYFFEARNYTVQQRNGQVVDFSGKILVNRGLYGALSMLFLVLAYRLFSYPGLSAKEHKKKSGPVTVSPDSLWKQYTRTQVNFGRKAALRSVLSFARTDLIYLFKSIAVPAVSILLLFLVGMEMYAEIEKGIRLPQKYAGSGLMATAISENFYLPGLLVIKYFVNDLYWRSKLSGFSLMEEATCFSKNKLAGHLLAITVLIFFFTGLLIAEGLAFQWLYDYFFIDGKAYLGIIIFNTLPLLLFSAFVFLLNDRLKNRFLALGLSVLAVFTLTGPVAKKLLSYPLLQIFSDYKGGYSDFNGYGVYTAAFLERGAFGLSLIAALWIINQCIKRRKWNFSAEAILVLLLISGIYSGRLFMKGYRPADTEKETAEAVAYEKQFRKYENLPQPDITDVQTEIALYPSANAYRIRGKYTLKNQADQPVYRVLLHFHPDLKIEKAWWRTAAETKKIREKVSEIDLNQPLLPGETATLDFEISCKWFAVNGHKSFNAIVENGSFMRISRYYPVVGYLKEREIEDRREEYGLGEPSGLRSVDAPAVFKKDFIRLNMLVSTEKSQTAIGTGDLTEQFKRDGRSYLRYEAQNIPFRFAVSSARYKQESVVHKGIPVHVFYHEKHAENVGHLIANARLTLDYCIQNFGQYPFRSVTFAEVSSFTRGFAATAYPAAIFMPEDMVFHANIHADKEQDVINELAGHELSHLWWGNSRINPDEREGAAMLTETLAMYTEMMLYQKMHGREKMQERLKVHQQIYDSEKGLSENQPLYKVTAENSHISYSKGAIAMVKLSELIGEDRVNLALRKFLIHNQYPKKPSTSDLLNEFYKVSDKRDEIDLLFKTP